MNRKGKATRDQLMDAAAALFAERGIDSVTLAELHEETGQKNKSAVQYHFGSRVGLIEAIVRRRLALADERRAVLLQEDGEQSLESLIHALVRPAAENLQTSSGRDYLRVVSQVSTRFSPGGRVTAVGGLIGETLRRIGGHLGHLPDAVVHLRLTATLTFFVEMMATRAERVEKGAPDLLPHDVFEDNLVAMIEGMLTAPAPDGRGHTHGTAEPVDDQPVLVTAV